MGGYEAELNTYVIPSHVDCNHNFLNRCEKKGKSSGNSSGNLPLVGFYPKPNIVREDYLYT